MKYLIVILYIYILLLDKVKSFNNVENCTAFSTSNTNDGTVNTVICTSSFLICYPDTIVFTGKKKVIINIRLYIILLNIILLNRMYWWICWCIMYWWWIIINLFW